MNNNPISFEKFKTQIEEILDQQLNEKAEIAAKDFWNNWSSFESLLDNPDFSLNVDAFRLRHNFPEYSNYNVWKGLGIILLIIGILSLLLIWKIAVIILIIGLGFIFFGNNVKYKDAKKFSNELLDEAITNPDNSGNARIMANYIAGIVQFAAPSGRSSWPQFPSNVLNGKVNIIS